MRLGVKRATRILEAPVLEGEALTSDRPWQMTRVVRPMMAMAASVLPIGPVWSYEVKWDGYRTLAVKDGDRVTLLSRNLKHLTTRYPSIARAVGRLAVQSATLDGEIVAVDEDGRPSFQALQHRITSRLTIAYYVFDVLALNGRDLVKQPLAERRQALSRLSLHPPILLSEPLPGAVEHITAAVQRLKLEGLVAKRLDSRYEPGKRSDEWVKVRFANRQEFVVGGYTPAATTFDSLLAGYYKGRQLWFAGKVRAGLTPHLRREISARITPLRVTRCPFVNLPSTKRVRWGEGVTATEMATLQWVKPTLVIDVSFTEWTRDGNLRHAAFVGMRDDKAAREVRRET
jgi:bifunctional non-homologous end joining protein LigD